jgi:hypothetical protein
MRIDDTKLETRLLDHGVVDTLGSVDVIKSAHFTLPL